MTITVDIGNTRTKVGFFNNNSELTRHYNLPDSSDYQPLVELLHAEEYEDAIVSTVRTDFPPDLAAWLSQKQVFLFFDETTPVPIQNLYQTPKTLGKDRLAAVIGAAHLFPQEGCLVIDAGTCITYDFINQQQQYWGGSITPGLEMRYKALNQFTASLPLLKKQRLNTFVGFNTETAIGTGIEHGVRFEIQGFIQQYSSNFGQIKVIMTGGDATHLAPQMENKIFVIPDLVLIGLNKILQHNANFSD